MLGRPFLIVLALGIVPATAHAQSADDKKAEMLFRDGRAAADRGDFATACKKFEESAALTRRPGTLLNLAECAERDRKLLAARTLIEESRAQLPPGDERIPFTEDKLRTLDAKVPRIKVSLALGSPADATVTLDGRALDASMLGLPQRVDPGEHVAVAAAPGQAEVRSTVTIDVGESRDIELGFAETRTVPRDGAGLGAVRGAGIAVAAVGVVSIVIGSITGGLTIGKKNEMEENCVPACNDAAREAADAGKTLSAVSTATFVIGGAALTAGVIMIAVGGPAEEPAAAMVPWMGPESGGLALRASF